MEGIPLKPVRRLCLLLAACAAAFSCSGDGGGPRPEPFEASHCTLLWYRARPAGVFDVYSVEMPVADWTNGTHTYDGVTRLGLFYYGLFDSDEDGVFEQFEDATSATSGEFTLSEVEGTDDGDDVGFSDAVAQAYPSVGGIALATGGTGNFDGVWSSHTIDDGEGEPAFADASTIALAYQGSNLQLGSVDFGAFGFCWDDGLALSSSSTRAKRLPSLWRRETKPQ